MSRRAWIGAAIAAACCIAFLVTCASAPPPSLPGPTVFIDTGHATGSGVYIGGEAILTAAHVVEGVKTVTITTEDGRKLPGTVSLIPQRDDLAIVQVENPKVQAAPLACRQAVKGEAIRVEGNPVTLRFVTTWGRVSSGGVTEQDFWPHVIVLDATVAPGSSGGPVFDAQGEVLAILVGMVVYPINTPYSFAVPSSTICALLGRVA